MEAFVLEKLIIKMYYQKLTLVQKQGRSNLHLGSLIWIKFYTYLVFQKPVYSLQVNSTEKETTIIIIIIND